MSAFPPQSAQVQQQAGVAPPPVPRSGPADAAAIAQPAPAPRAAPRHRPAPPGTSLVGWVTGPDSPNDTIKRFAITGTDLGIMWDNGDPGNHQVLMAFGDTIRLLRCPRQAVAVQHVVPHPGRRAVQYGRSPEWRCQQQVLGLTAVGAGAFEADHQQHQVRADGDGHHPDVPASPSATTNTSTSCRSRTGTAQARGRRTSRRSRCPPTTASTGVSTRDRPAVRAEQRRPGPLRPGQRELPDGGVPQARPRRPLHLLVRDTARTRRFGVRVARRPGLVPDLQQVRVLERRQRLGPGQSGCRDAGDPRARSARCRRSTTPI